jgi:hypothetical protein
VRRLEAAARDDQDDRDPWQRYDELVAAVLVVSAFEAEVSPGGVADRLADANVLGFEEHGGLINHGARAIEVGHWLIEHGHACQAIDEAREETA